MTDVRLPFGLRGDALFHISEVKRGLACDCVCPGCRDRLVAKQGSTAHHYAHYANTECTYSAESALHRYAKQLFIDQEFFALPPLPVRVDRPQYGIALTEIIPGETVTVRATWIERAYADVIPDVQLETATDLLFVEIVVTNAANPVKREKLKRIGLPAVAIKLDKLRHDMPLLEIRAAVLEDVTCRTWIHHPKMEEILARLNAQADAQLHELEAIALAEKKAAAKELAEQIRQAEAAGQVESEDQHDPAGAELIALARKIDAAQLDAILHPQAPLDRLNLYAAWRPVEKLAYSCWLLNRPAAHLPSWFNSVEPTRQTFRDPAVVWRTGVFFRFVAKNARSFNVADVAAWCVQRYPVHAWYANPVTDGDAAYWSVTCGQHAIYAWLAELEGHEFLSSDGWLPAVRRFSPRQRRLPK